MSFSLSAWGHAATAEAEAEVVKAAKAFWDAIQAHLEPESGSGASISTQNHGSGTVEDVHAIVTAAPPEGDVPPSSDATTETGGTTENGAG